MNIVLAPHIDDELIGVYSILNNIDEVYYFFDITNERKLEALATGKKFQFKCKFNEILKLKKEDKIYVCTSMDLHKDHKYVNKLAKQLQQKIGFKLMYYSIDMNRKPNFLSTLHQNKKEDLYALYPSQKKLFDSDEKYFLFEDIFENDYIESVIYKIFKDDKYIKLTIENTYSWSNILNNLPEWYHLKTEDVFKIVFDKILKQAPDNIEPTNITLEIKTNKVMQRKYRL